MSHCRDVSVLANGLGKLMHLGVAFHSVAAPPAIVVVIFGYLPRSKRVERRPAKRTAAPGLSVTYGLHVRAALFAWMRPVKVALPSRQLV
jgi:hypothetical protein